MTFCNLDFETASCVDLTKHGAYRYAKDPSTHAICCGYKYGDGPIKIWLPPEIREIVEWGGHPPPDTSMQPGDKFTAFNAAFDRRIYNIVAGQNNWQLKGVEDWLCTMVLAQANGLPGSLEKSSTALGIPKRKDPVGKLLINLLSLPISQTHKVLADNLAGLADVKDANLISFARGLKITDAALDCFCELSKKSAMDFIFDLGEYLINAIDDGAVFNRHPVLLKAMIKYCRMDVAVESEILGHLIPLAPHELNEYHAFERMNDTGIPIDLPTIEKLVPFCAEEKEAINAELNALTNGGVKTVTSHAQAKKWLTMGYELDGDSGYRRKTGARIRMHQKCIDIAQLKAEKDGEISWKLSTDKNVKQRLLDLYANDRTVMSKKAALVLELLLGHKSALAKFESRLNKQWDGRVHDAYSFCGAPSTKRTSSKGGDNWQNQYRECPEDFDDAMQKIFSGGLETRKKLQECAKLLRPTIKARKGYIIIGADFSSQESRATPVLCGTPDALKKIAAFKAQDADPSLPDMYVLQAQLMELKEEDYPGLTLRQLGKGGELGCNFGGGAGAIHNTTRGQIPLDVAAEIAERWNFANPWNRPFCKRIKEAAWAAMRDPGEPKFAGKLVYYYLPDTHNGLGALVCELPNGTCLYYVDAKIEKVPSKWDPDTKIWELTAIKASFSPKAGETKWPRIALWYGTLIENATQAYGATTTKTALVTLDKRLPISPIMQTHDEIVMEVPESELNYYAGELVAAMVIQPASEIDGLPLVANVEYGKRYSKYPEGTISMAQALDYYNKYNSQGARAHG